jgi:hypothetical protein
MKKLLFCLMALSALILSSCEDNGGDSSNTFEGKWAFIADYDDEDGWFYYYDEAYEYIEIIGNSFIFYEYDGALEPSFKNGYYNCSEDDFYRDSDKYTFTIDGNKAYFAPNADEYTYMEIKNGKLYLYDTDTPDDGYCEMYERVKGFNKD